MALHRSGWLTTFPSPFTQKIPGSHSNKMLGASQSQSRLEWQRISLVPTGVRTPNSPSRSELLYQIHYAGPLSYAAVKTVTRQPWSRVTLLSICSTSSPILSLKGLLVLILFCVICFCLGSWCNSHCGCHSKQWRVCK